MWWTLLACQGLRVPELERENTELAARVAELEGEVDALKTQVDERDHALGICAMDPIQQREAAGALFEQAVELIHAWDHEGARSTLDQLARDFPDSGPNGRAASLRLNLEAVGLGEAPLDQVRWLQGQGAYSEGVTVVVFFEEWCPPCWDEMPGLQAKSKAMPDVGFIGLTGMKRAATQEKVEAMLQETGTTYPVGVDTGAVAEHFRVQGTPALAVVHQGTVVWRGHPMGLDWAMVEGLR